MGALATTEDQKNLQNFLICVEMLPAAVGMLFAFPYHEYKGTGVQAPHLLVNYCVQTGTELLEWLPKHVRLGTSLETQLEVVNIIGALNCSKYVLG